MYVNRTVRETSDLKRIRAIARRPRPKLKAKATRALVRKWTRELALVSDVELVAAQAIAFEEMTAAGGAYLSYPVGTGKTITSECAPTVLESKRAGLILPASKGLKDKAFANRRALRGRWRIASPPARVITLNELARDENADLLFRLDLDLLVIDESDDLANWDASAVQRIDRFLAVKRGWDPHRQRYKNFGAVRVVAMTGTPTRNSILGDWHIIRWCFESPPVPYSRSDAQLWAAALDNGSCRSGWRPDPGALGETAAEAREWYVRRLEETRGIVFLSEDSAAGVPLSIEIKLAPRCAKLTRAYDKLLTEWESPAGEPVTDALSMHRIDGQLGCGLITYYEPPPPKPWAEARRALGKLIRRRIKATRHAMRPLDTEKQVISDTVKHGAERDRAIVSRWLEVKPTYDQKAHAKIKWISDRTLAWVGKWLMAGEEPTILWCGCVEFGRRLARELKVPYYGKKGVDENSGRTLVQADAKYASGRGRKFVASYHANKRGFDLQPWRRQGIVFPPRSGKDLEQTIGRGHRQGQTQPVRFTILATSGGTLDAFVAAYSEAEFAQDTKRNIQKILRAEILPIPAVPDELRWVTKNEDDEE
jgi:hypothetical protein